MLDGASTENPSSPSHLQNLSPLGSFPPMFTCSSLTLNFGLVLLKFPAEVQKQTFEVAFNRYQEKGKCPFYHSEFPE